MNDGIKKEIDFLLARRSSFMTILLLSISGTIGLALNFKLWYLILITLGFLTFILFLKGIARIDKRIKCLIKELKNEL
ncbi:MAG: hypothetical protein A2Y25_11125 [Candidatus Melainabacteria bacterium GWF2_37_15]|nr:MAG: hypothetical protein A2Y25_11125 [Candidatus Melainabacteria bacterium GWF2_37_15]